MAITDEDRRKKEFEAERAFREWLDLNQYPYWYILQDEKWYSKGLKMIKGSKRPDFLILIPRIGLILTDVKNKPILKKHPGFHIDKEETDKYCHLKREFNQNIWFVLGSKTDYFNTWYWITAEKVREKGTLSYDKKYYYVRIADCIQIVKKDNIVAKLFT